MTIRDELNAHVARCHEAIESGQAPPRWSGADLRYADLHGANLSHVNLSGAKLHRANLSRAYLHRANLASADLVGVNLTGANLTSADLSGANLADADLAGADLRGADLTSANLRGANGICVAGPVGVEGRLIYAVSRTDGPMIYAGCFVGTVAEMIAAIETRYADGTGREQFRSSYLAAVAFVATITSDIDWPGLPAGAP